MSLILLATARFSEGLAIAETIATEQGPANQNPQPGVRGSGENLEFRLHGRILGGTDGAPPQPKLEVFTNDSEKTFPVRIVGEQFEVWLPIKEFKWASLSIRGSCQDGRRAIVTIASAQMRTAIEQGIEFQFQRPARSVTFQVQHQNKGVAEAHVEVRTSLGRIQTGTDSTGKATVDLLPGEQPSACTAWTDDGRLGGFQFFQMPKRDPNANEHTVELFACKSRKLVVLDTDGAPVAGLRVQVDVATAEPYFNYLGRPADYEVVTDANGSAEYAWIPDWKEVHLSDVDFMHSDWVHQTQTVHPDRIEVVVKKAAARVPFEGVVSRGGESVAGVIIEAYSFQGESEHQSDMHMIMADANGKFSFSALPQSTYAIFAHDDRLVSDAVITMPVDPATGQKNSAQVSLIDGQPVTVLLTSGPTTNPLSTSLSRFVLITHTRG